MRRTIGLMMLMLAAGCGPAAAPGANESNAAKPAASAVTGALSEAQQLAQRREDALRGCIGGGRDAAGPNVPVEAHCTCAIDRLMEGRSHADLEAEERTGEYATRFSAAMRQCRREIGDGPRP
jgi:hypothetical protein